jgi:hypothetical protein
VYCSNTIKVVLSTFGVDTTLLDNKISFGVQTSQIGAVNYGKVKFHLGAPIKYV